jgi:hypothetical protein
MKKILKWVLIIIGILAVIGFLGFLYFIPPFTLVPPEGFSKPTADAAPDLSGITNPVERLLAERGKYIVTTSDCSGCHTPIGDNGPEWDRYLSGGARGVFRGYGTFRPRNLTADKETGLARRTDDQVKRVLQSGLLPEGRIAHYRDMPWAFYSNWTAEDRHAVIVYLRHLKPVNRKIPDDDTSAVFLDPTAVEEFF